MRRDKDRTKTSTDRIVEPCPRALQALKRQLEPIRNLNDPYDHCVWTLRKSVKVSYRERYNARHSFVSWNLMIGKNLLWVSKQHGHSVQTMLSKYAAWIERAKDEDVEAIKRAMNARPAAATSEIRVKSPSRPTNMAPEPRQNCVSRWMHGEMYGGREGTRTRRRK